ncbi:MAG: UDP-N-acetylmuramate dehydrogenase [Alphaproteobacteria bacterium]|nr:UDP-N-acetylmuramate dehydrogenase [Alphaproteobacteria bacterium]MDE2337090.1 UDP-N-acetylmuramate dehydrogenase [Alphaproteobacteria bacterium]
MSLPKLPAVRGRLTYDAPLGQQTWFGVGGPAEVLFKPADKQDLMDFIKNCPREAPVTVLGVASNLIIRDGGIPGVVIRLGRDFADIKTEGTKIAAGAAALDMNVALAAARASVAGLEFFSGIPGTIGGALRMNAGAYGKETKDVLISAEVLFRDGTVKTMTAAEMDMSYRHNGLPDDVIFLGARLQGETGDPDAIAAKIDEIKTKRAESQPIRSKTGGSTFANPENGKAWQLIDAAGCRGLKVGAAQMSEMHANFMINTGGATAADIERLGEKVREKVYAQSGVMLRWEIKRVGLPLEQDADIAAWMQKEIS